MSLRSAACASVVLASAAAAQCLDWSRGYPTPGTIDGLPPTGAAAAIEALVVDHTTVPPTLVLGGDFVGAGDVESAHAVRWNGSAYTHLAGLEEAVLGMWNVDLGSGPVVHVGTRGYAGRLYRLQNGAWIELPAAPGPVKSLVAFDSGHGLELHAVEGVQWGGSIPGRVHRLSSSGWVPLAGDLDGHPEALAVFDDGNGPALYAGGRFRRQIAPSFTWARGIARWSNGSWVEVGGGLLRSNLDAAFVSALAVHDFGAGPRLVVGGQFDSAGEQSIANLAAWDGSSWSAVVPGLNGVVDDLASVDLPSGPRLAVGGAFSAGSAGSARSPILVDGASVIELGPAFADPLDGPSYAVSEVRAFVVHDDGRGPSLFTGGDFVQVGGRSAIDVARLQGSTWHALTAPDGIVGDVLALARHDDGSGPAVYAGGRLTAVGGVLHREVGRYDGTTWTPVGPASTPPTTRVEALLSADVGDGPRLYAGGVYTAIGGVAAGAIACWDGATWAPLAGGDLANGASGQPGVLALTKHDDGSGAALYVGGGFQSAGGVASTNIARWKPGVGWTSVAGGLPALHFVRALASFDDGGGARLYAGCSTDGVFRFDGAAWEALPGAPTNPGRIHALGVYPFGDEPLLFVGGEYQTIGGVGALNLAAWTGSTWRTFGQGASGLVNSSVRAFHLYDDGTGGLPKLAAVGRFTQVDAIFGGSCALWDGAAWSSPSGGVSGTAYAAASLDDGDGPSLFLGGEIQSTNGVVAVNFARYGWTQDTSCSPTTGSSFCDGSGGATACPCGNSGLASRGCANSANADGARLRARGAANVSDDSVTLELAGTTPNAPALYFQGTSAIAAGAGSVFGDGVRCAGGSVRRLGVRQSVAGTSSFGAGVAGSALVSVAGDVDGGTTRLYQVWYRDPNPTFCTSATYNLSNGLRIHWAP